MPDAALAPAAGIRQRGFGHLPDGREVTEFNLDNGAGLSLSAISPGGIVTALNVPDRTGRVANVVLGFSSLADFTLAASRYATIDAHLIPIELESVDGMPFDFRQAARIAERIRHIHPQLAIARGTARKASRCSPTSTPVPPAP